MINHAVYSLINNLSKSEKRYFIVNASINKTNKKLIKMYELIKKQQNISKSELIKLLKLKNDQQLAVLETRLYHLILKHLRQFSAEESANIKLNNYLSEIEILYNKGLKSACIKLINKAKLFSLQTSNTLYYLELLKWESKVIKEEGKYLKKCQNQLNAIKKEELKITEKYKRKIQYKYHAFNSLILSKNLKLPEKNRANEYYNKLYNSGYFKIDHSHDLEEKVYVLNTLALYYMGRGNIKKCLTTYNELVNTIETSNNKTLIKHNEYFLALNNLLLLQAMNKKFQDSEQTLKKIYTHFGNSTKFKRQLFSITKCYELGIYCEIGDLKNGKIFLKTIENDLENYKNDINDVSLLLYYLNISLMYFYAEAYKQAIFWIQKFLNEFNINRNHVASNMFYYGNILRIIYQFDLGKFENIDYLIAQCKKTISKIKPISVDEKYLLQSIEKLVELSSLSYKKEYSDLLNKMKIQFEKFNKNESLLINQFLNINLWLESKITKKPLHQLLYKKALNNA
jgi:hypothetical protein